MVAVPLLSILPFAGPEAAKWDSINILGTSCNNNFTAVDIRLRKIEERLGAGTLPLHIIGDSIHFDLDNRVRKIETSSGMDTASNELANLRRQVSTLSEQVAELKKELADRPRHVQGVEPW